MLSSKPGKRILATPTILVSCCIYGEARGSRVSSAYMAVPQGQVFLININTMKLYSITNENKHMIFHRFVLEAHIFAIDQNNLQVTNDVDTFFQQRSQYMALPSSYCYQFVVINGNLLNLKGKKRLVTRYHSHRLLL